MEECVQILQHFIWGTCASSDFGIHGDPGPVPCRYWGRTVCFLWLSGRRELPQIPGCVGAFFSECVWMFCRLYIREQFSQACCSFPFTMLLYEDAQISLELVNIISSEKLVCRFFRLRIYKYYLSSFATRKLRIKFRAIPSKEISSSQCILSMLFSLLTSSSLIFPLMHFLPFCNLLYILFDSILVAYVSLKLEQRSIFAKNIHAS